MKTKLLLKYCIRFSKVLFIAALIQLTGCSKENSSSKTPENQSQQTEKNESKDLSIIRDKNVNIDSLDQDKDGNLYQCEMDYNVISDKPGTCPKCGMKLVKVSTAEAKKNFNAFNGNE
jgi:major membrane immunogen (membrane-anchored lipoprotein)